MQDRRLRKHTPQQRHLHPFHPARCRGERRRRKINKKQPSFANVNVKVSSGSHTLDIMAGCSCKKRDEPPSPPTPPTPLLNHRHQLVGGLTKESDGCKHTHTHIHTLLGEVTIKKGMRPWRTLRGRLRRWEQSNDIMGTVSGIFSSFFCGFSFRDRKSSSKSD